MMSEKRALYQSEWHGQPAWTLETEQVRIVAVPQVGAKIVSIFDKQAGHEWLVLPGTRPFQPVAYGSVFIDQDMSGWDEMYPTIVAGPYPAEGPYKGAWMPDHGEVWALPWEVTQAGDGILAMAVNGRALPYRLERSLSMEDAHTLRMSYHVINTADEPFAAFWTAHPQFAVTPQTEVVLPERIHNVINVKETDRWGEVGLVYNWPNATTQQNTAFRLDRVARSVERSYRKFYALPDQRVEWAALRERDGGHWLRLDWDPEQIPYLGLWMDEGGPGLDPVIALEPSTGYYDELGLAWRNKRVPLVEPGHSYSWQLTMRLGSGHLGQNPGA